MKLVTDLVGVGQPIGDRGRALQRARCGAAVILGLLTGAGVSLGAGQGAGTADRPIRVVEQQVGDMVVAVALNPAFDSPEPALRALLMIHELVNLSITTPTSSFSSDLRTCTINSSCGFNDAADVGYIVERFEPRIVNVRTAGSMGLPVGVDFPAMFQRYFSLHPSAHSAWAWRTSLTNSASSVNASLSNLSVPVPTDLKSFDQCGERVGYRLNMSGSPNLGYGGVCGLRWEGTVSANKLCFYADTNDNVGHGFVELLEQTDQGSTRQVVGKYPAFLVNLLNQGGPGSILDDSTHDWDTRVCFPVTAEKYRKAKLFVTAQKALSDASPSGIVYRLLSDNCMSWAVEVAAKAGLSLPSSSSYGLIPDPEKFHSSLSSLLGAPPLTGCGRVSASADRSGAADAGAGSGATFSVGALIRNGLGNPAQVAADLGHPLRIVTLPPVGVRPGQPFTVALNGADVTQSICALEWGDGAPVEALIVNFEHVFGADQNVSVKVLLIDQAAVHHYTIPVSVSVGAPDGPVTVTASVPPLPPVFTPAPLPPALPGVAPGPFFTASPPNGATGVGFQPSLTWTPSQNAAYYEVELATDPVFQNKLLSTTAQGTEFALPRGALRGSTTYFLRVTAVSDNNFYITEADPGAAVFTTHAPTCPQDIDGSGVVDTFDLVPLLSSFGQPLTPLTRSRDINGDGTVDTLDLTSFLNRFGLACQ